MEATEEMVEAVARALYRHAVQSARSEFESVGLGLKDAISFFPRLKGESDAALVILITSYIDSQMTESWCKNMRGIDKSKLNTLFAYNGPLSTMSAKVKLARCLNWISEDVSSGLDIIRSIRNKFAHDPYKHSLEEPDIVLLIDRLPAEEHILVKIASEYKNVLPLSARLRFHIRSAFICLQAVVQMVTGPIAIRHRIHPGSIVRYEDEHSELYHAVTKALVVIGFELLGFDMESHKTKLSAW